MPAELRRHAHVEVSSRLQSEKTGAVFAGADRYRVTLLQLEIGLAIDTKDCLLSRLQRDMDGLTAR